jgi:hypothetical protein
MKNVDMKNETPTDANNVLAAGLNEQEKYILKLAKGSTLVRHSGDKLFYRYWVEHSDGRVMTELHYSTLVKLSGCFFDKYFSVTIPTNAHCRQYYKLKSELGS